MIEQGHYPAVQEPAGRSPSPRDAARIARALLAGEVGLEAARPAVEVLAALADGRRGRCPVATVQLDKPSALGTEAVRKLRAGLGAELLIADVVGVYLFAYAGEFGREDPEFVGNRRALTTANARAVVLVRKNFPGAELAARYAARAVRFWHLRSERQRWPGPRPPRFDALCDDRMLACWRAGEIDREVTERVR